jgi:hypothetical protein
MIDLPISFLEREKEEIQKQIDLFDTNTTDKFEKRDIEYYEKRKMKFVKAINILKEYQGGLLK